MAVLSKVGKHLSKRARRRRAGAKRESQARRRLNHESLEPRVVLSTTYLITEIAPLVGMETTAASDINDTGIVVGTSSRAGLVPASRAFQYDAANGTQDLGTFGGENARATAINDVGQIVGAAEDGSGKSKGFRHDPGTGLLDLGGVGTNAGVYPAGINNNGDVVGNIEGAI